MFRALSRRAFLQAAAGGGACGLLLPELTGCGARLTGTSDDIAPQERAAMASLAEQFRNEHDAPGLSIAIARNGLMKYEQAFGFTEHDGAEALEISSLFRIASISKPITSVAIFKLIEQGQLRLDSKIFGEGAVLGTDYGSRPYGADLQRITVDHLLTHTAGGWSNKRDDPMFSNVSMSQGELISWVLDNRSLQYPPGSVYDYSNFGYCLLGRVIERVAGQRYPEEMMKMVGR